MTSLGFENYAEALKVYLSKYREVSRLRPCHTEFVTHTSSSNRTSPTESVSWKTRGVAR